MQLDSNSTVICMIPDLLISCGISVLLEFMIMQYFIFCLPGDISISFVILERKGSFGCLANYAKKIIETNI